MYTTMKKIYSKPLTEVVTYNLETFIAASDVRGANGLDDDLEVESPTNNPSSFSKQYDLWSFEEEK